MSLSLIRTIILAFVAALALAGAPLTFTPFHSSGIYKLGERVGWHVAKTPGDADSAQSFRYVIRRNNKVELASGDLDLSSGRAEIAITVNEPSILYVDVFPAASPADKKAAMHLGAAISPSKLQPSQPRPADFDSFWETKLKALAEVPVNPVLTPTPSTKPGVDFYTVKLDSLGSHMQGYLAKPAREGKFPALVLYQYAGVYALKPESSIGRAAEGWLVLNVNSHDMPPDHEKGVSTSYASIGYTDRESCYFLNMYLRDARAIDYIASRPDWDGRTLVISGTSMGGQQSMVVAGLRSQVTAVLVNVPAGFDLNADLHGRKAGYPYWPSGNADVMKTAPYFDPVNFASRIKAPVLAGIGLIDTTSPPAGIWSALNQIPGPKEVVAMVESDHNNRTPDKQGAWNARFKQVMADLLAGAGFQPRPLSDEE